MKYEKYIIPFLVWLSVALYFIEVSVFDASNSLGSPMGFLWAERIIALIFTGEIMWRLNKSKEYFMSSYFWIDLIAVIPFWIGFVVPVEWLGWVRTLRILRLLKLVRYNRNLQLILDAFKNAIPILKACLTVMTVFVLFSSALIYQAEHAAQPDKFDSIGSCIYFCITTATTTGYGDLSPITPLGRVLTIVTLFGPTIALCGIIFGIMSDSYSRIMNDQ